MSCLICRQSLAQHQQRHRNVQPAGVGPSRRAYLFTFTFFTFKMCRANTRLYIMYRVAHTPVGDPWTHWLTLRSAPLGGPSGSHAWTYIPISTSHDAYKVSFLTRTIIAWNQLPSIIIVAPSFGGAFRSRLITSKP